MTTNQLLGLMLGGEDGGVCLSSPVTTGTFDYILADAGVTFTVMENQTTDILSTKGLSAHALTNQMLIAAGRGKSFKKLTWSGGDVWGYKKSASTDI